MDRNNRFSRGAKMGLELSADALKGKQSVRATFTLPKELIELLSLVSAQLGIKQKSLFDQLVEDINILKQIADDAQHYSPRTKGRRQKTFVLSRRSLISLDLVARQQQMPRDILVEFSIQRLLPLITAEQKKHEKRKLLLEDMDRYLEHGKMIVKKTGTLLGHEDHVYHMIDELVARCEQTHSELAALIERGKEIEKFG